MKSTKTNYVFLMCGSRKTILEASTQQCTASPQLPTPSWGGKVSTPRPTDGQYLRVRRNCSSFNNLKKESNILQKRFSDRGYPNKTLKKAYQHASTQNRLDLLTKNTPTKTDDITRIIGTYDMAAPEVRKILDTFWPILRRDPFVAEFIPGRQSLTFRRGRFRST